MARPDEVTHGWMHGREFLIERDVTGHQWNGHDFMRGPDKPEFTDVPMPKGTRVKVVMVSRFGDCGITTDLKAENGYISRVPPEWLVLPEDGDHFTECGNCGDRLYDDSTMCSCAEGGD